MEFKIRVLKIWSFLVLGCFVLIFSGVIFAENCPKTSPLVGFETDFMMVQHQLRGIVTILDDCSFRVSRFDMIEGEDVNWWGAKGEDFENLTLGFRISDEVLNRTYKNESLVVELKNSTWDSIKVLAVWDKTMFSDFGHVILIPRNDSSNSSDISAPAPAPGPSPSPSIPKSLEYTQPTMFDNCKSLSPDYRLRWTLSSDRNLVDIGLEGAVSSQHYMAFGWAAKTNDASQGQMLRGDVAVTGFTEEGFPFADDYFITQYSECLLNKEGVFQGVCPDAIYQGTDGLVNNTKLVYGHRVDGVSFVRYQRPLKTPDRDFDIEVNASDNMTVIWALGLIRPPDTLRPYYLPQYHSGVKFVNYGFLSLNVSDSVNDCLGPLEAKDKEDQDLIVADGKTTLVVTTDPALHYPNPPNPTKVLYINKKEAPLLRVERGVPVKFSIQAGHEVALYITSDPIGGNATLRNASEIIFAGGPDAHGVPASPTELVWQPDRNTPDHLYYQSIYGQKMGWKVEIVDGGLSDMYTSSVFLDDQQVTLFWTLSEDTISLAVRGEKKSGYVAIGFGTGMVNSFVYVGWVDNEGVGHVNTYWIDGRDASNIHPTNENLTYVRCKLENNIITYEFTRPLDPSCSNRVECKNVIDPNVPLRVIWAMGARWSNGNLSEANMHSVTSSKPVRVLLMRGSAEAEQDLRPVLGVHGFMMFLAWGILLPGGILAARYLKHVKGDGWYQSHVYLQYSGIAIMLLGVLFAAAELRGFSFSSVHVKFGVTALVLACIQPVNAYLRPKKPALGEEVPMSRVVWEYGHVITGRSAVLVGIGALVSGLKHLGDRYGGEHVHGLNWALMAWFFIGAMVVFYLEYWEIKRRKTDAASRRSDWVMGNSDDDDSTDLLHSKRPLAEDGSHTNLRMEVQLEPLNR